MHKQFLTSTLLFLCLTFSVESSAESEKRPIVTGHWYTLNSKIMQESREYAVHLPFSYHDNPEQHFPVIYVLDGHSTQMRGVGGMIESLSYYELNQQLPEVIVVAIPNTNRTRDFTPTKGDLAFQGEILDKLSENSGGAERFATFIREELFTAIDTNFRTTDDRSLIGMSFGGLFTGYVLLTQPQMFSRYLLSDPTSIWDSNYLNRTLMLNKHKLLNKKIRVFVGLANNDHLGQIGIANRQWGNDFISGLKEIDNAQLHVSQRYFPNEVHATVMYLAYYYGLIELFRKDAK